MNKNTPIRMLIFSFISLFMSLKCSYDTSDNLRIMTFNIRYDNPEDGADAWQYRKDYVVSMIRFHRADVVGLQEALKHQVDYLSENLPEYNWFGVGRDDGKTAGEFMAVFYRKGRLDSLRTSTFWLSETPEKPGLGWDAVCNRVVTWGRFKDKSNGNVFYLFNTHFDHRGEIARAESAHLLLDRVTQISGNHPLVITGDFNATPDSKPYQILTTSYERQQRKKIVDSRFTSRFGHHGPDGTFNGFNLNALREEPIDYIFVDENIDVIFHGTLSDTFNGHYPSDHLPVLVEVIFK